MQTLSRLWPARRRRRRYAVCSLGKESRALPQAKVLVRYERDARSDGLRAGRAQIDAGSTSCSRTVDVAEWARWPSPDARRVAISGDGVMSRRATFSGDLQDWDNAVYAPPPRSPTETPCRRCRARPDGYNVGLT